MASYHFSVQIIQRSQGRSVLAAAAYRAGERIRDEKTNQLYDYSKRRGVVHSEVLAPPGSASFLSQRGKLWNYVEQQEGRKDAQLAREINLALPHELDVDARRKLLLSFVQEAFVSRGMVADVAIHAPVLEKGDHPHNHHAHILLTLRQATPSGLRGVKTREWNSDQALVEWRALWAEHQNQTLERAGVVARVDHRKLAVQRDDAVRRTDWRAAAGLDREPEIHLGKSQRRPMEFAKRSVRPHAQRSERNGAILLGNAARARARLEAWQKAYMRELHRAQKPRKAMSSAKAPKRPGQLALPLHGLFRGPPKTLAGHLQRISAGISIWQGILGKRQARHSDFRSRYLVEAITRELVRSDGRQRLRVRQLDAPPVPERMPAALKPVAHLASQDGVRQLARHQNDRAPVGKAHDLRGIDEIARSLANALRCIATKDIDVRF